MDAQQYIVIRKFNSAALLIRIVECAVTIAFLTLLLFACYSERKSCGKLES